MIAGVLFVFAACFIWGLFFVAPQFLTVIFPLHTMYGNFLFLGLIVLFAFIFHSLYREPKLSLSVWKKALFFAFFANIVYYTGLILGLRYSSASVTALIMGISPISISIYANLKKKEIRFRTLLIPSILILFGLILVNFPTFHESQHFSLIEYCLGLCCSFLALLAWTWFVIQNSKFLRDNPQIPSSQWSKVIGCATIFWVIVLGLLIILSQSENLPLHQYITISSESRMFLLGCSILGIFCSWVGSYLWNRASSLMPLALAGQLMIFETIFGLTFIYLLEQRWPLPLELTGVVFMLSGILTSYYSFKKSVFVPILP
jgi:drug/metabolite transporter (DMT)-like permease